MKKLFVSLLGLLLMVSTALADNLQYRVPAPGSAERKEILNSVRPFVERIVGQKVKLYVRGIAAKNMHALVFVIPEDQNGMVIEPEKYAEKKSECWAFALLEKRKNKWVVLEQEFSIGDGLDQWMKKYPNVPKILFEAVGIMTNADGIP